MRDPAFSQIIDALDAASGASADAAIDPQALTTTRERLAAARAALGPVVRDSAYLAYARHLAVAGGDAPAPLAASA